MCNMDWLLASGHKTCDLLMQCSSSLPSISWHSGALLKNTFMTEVSSCNTTVDESLGRLFTASSSMYGASSMCCREQTSVSDSVTGNILIPRLLYKRVLNTKKNLVPVLVTELKSNNKNLKCSAQTNKADNGTEYWKSHNYWMNGLWLPFLSSLIRIVECHDSHTVPVHTLQGSRWGQLSLQAAAHKTLSWVDRVGFYRQLGSLRARFLQLEIWEKKLGQLSSYLMSTLIRGRQTSACMYNHDNHVS